MARAIIVGSAGQDGTLLSGQLHSSGHQVIGVDRTTGLDLGDPAAVSRFVSEHQPEEIYYLAAYHHSSQDPPIEPLELYANSHAVHVAGVLSVLEAIRTQAPRARLFYAASSLIFGDPVETPQTEDTPLRPTCIYGITKVTGLQLCRHYRRVHGVYASVGILYNHESPLRADKFVSKKVVKAAWEIKRGARETLVLGDLSAELDWGAAEDHVDAMRRILALDTADEFVIATGERHSVRELVELAFSHLGLDWKNHVEENPALITRPPLVRVGDAGKLTRATGWRPTTGFPAMVRALVDAEGKG